MFVLACVRTKTGTAQRLRRVAQKTRRPLGSAPAGLSTRFFCGDSNSKDGDVPIKLVDRALADGAAQKAKAGPQSPAALFVLGLYGKPALPGFYQSVQIGDKAVMDFLISLRKNGQGEYIAGFMTKEVPANKSGAEQQPAPISDLGVATTSPSLRRDGGRVSSSDELEEVGTVLQVMSVAPYTDGTSGQVVVMPHRRIRRARTVSNASTHAPLGAVLVDYFTEPDVPTSDDRVKALHHETIATMKELLKASPLHKDQFEKVVRFFDVHDPLKLADLVTGMSFADRSELQSVLQETDVCKRLENALLIAKKDLEGAKIQLEMKSRMEETMSTNQRKLMLTAQMKEIMKELGMEKNDKETLIEQYRDAVKDKTLPEEANKVFEAELAKMQNLEPSSNEFNVCRTYLDWLTPLPWGAVTEDNNSISKAEDILNEDHYGLEDVKERILEHIAVSFLKGSVQGKIMCLVGPPGVGKTSIGKSIAKALNRKFYHFSVGGLHDVAELRGHRRTYVGAMPGKLIQCLKNTQSSNPVVLIDEIDKLGRDMRGDPSSALLEILDPEQNNAFRDHYLDVPVDLSQVLFVCTANVLDTIPGPLLDRFEIIRIAGYVHEEKMAIAEKYLLPQVKESSGIGDESIQFEDGVISKIISEYAREAGVRSLKKLLEKVSRKVALNKMRSTDDTKEKEDITTENLSKYIGQPVHLSERLYPFGTPAGVVMGLAWTSLGGAHLFIEAQGRLPLGGLRYVDPLDPAASGEGKKGVAVMGGPMKVTGQLGQVMNESSAISLTYAKAFVRELNPWSSYLEEAHLHLNVPEGATPKDGPSAGVTMATALLSLALGQPVKTDLAMTGELTITGKVLKVGGIKEKVIAARRENISTLILPRHNEADFRELKEYLTTGITAHFVDHYDDVYALAFDSEAVPRLPRPSLGQALVTIGAPSADEPSAKIEGGNIQGDVFIPITPEPLPGSVGIAQMSTSSASEADTQVWKWRQN